MRKIAVPVLSVLVYSISVFMMFRFSLNFHAAVSASAAAVIIIICLILPFISLSLQTGSALIMGAGTALFFIRGTASLFLPFLLVLSSFALSAMMKKRSVSRILIVFGILFSIPPLIKYYSHTALAADLVLFFSAAAVNLLLETRNREYETLKKSYDHLKTRSSMLEVSPFSINKESVFAREDIGGYRVMTHIEDSIKSIVDIISDTFSARSVLFIIRDKNDGALYPEISVSSEPVRLHNAISNKSNILEWVSSNGESFMDNLFVSDPVDLEFYESPLTVIRSVMVVPVKYKDKVIGMIYVDSNEENVFTTKNLEILKKFADEISRILNFARYAEEAKLEATYISVLNDIAHKFSSSISVEEILDTVSDTMLKLLSADHLFVIEKRDNSCLIRKAFPSLPFRDTKVELSPYSFAMQGFSENSALIKHEIGAREITQIFFNEKERFGNINSAASVNVFHGADDPEGSLGNISVMMLFRRSMKDMKNIDILLGFIGDISSTAIARAMLYQRTKELAIKDGLTGLFNHRYFQDELSKLASLALRNRTKLALALLDIDYFKKFNDTYGHQTGDAVLKHLAAILSDAVRETDLAARYGGEEFVLILTNVNPESTVDILENIRHKIEQSSLQYEGKSLKITVSIGCAVFPDKTENRMELIKKADEALYKAKSSGRNAVFIAD